MTEIIEEIELLDDSFAKSPLGVHYHPDRIYIESREPIIWTVITGMGMWKSTFPLAIR